MAITDFNTEGQRGDLIYLIKKVKACHAELGSYIEHFHYNENVIIIKLTNGFIKLNESILKKHQKGTEPVNDKELMRIGASFVKTLL